MNRAEELLRKRIAEGGGAVSFEQFMADALHHPEVGYYARHVRPPGRRGDFSTAPSLGMGLGEAIAAWALEERARLSQSGTWHLVEIGAGGGQLAGQILRSLGWWHRLRLRFHIVETSTPLRARQAEALRRYRVEWHTDPREALESCGGSAILFSNELVDAFPCRIVERLGDSWQELHLDIADAALRETMRPIDPGSVPRSLRALPSPATPQRYETHDAWFRWLEKWTPTLRRGTVLTIDYGGSPREIYHRRPAGTIRAYAHHLRLDGEEIYRRFGHQDLTADVNFEDLAERSVPLGLVSEPLMTQGEFLRRHCPTIRSTPAATLLAEDAGAAFKVLRQRKTP